MERYPTGEALVKHFRSLEEAKLVNQGGQKAVYKARFKGKTIALKMIALGFEHASNEETSIELNTEVARALREVSILDKVDVQVLARSGPLGLSREKIGDSEWLFFTEEWIEGRCLRDMIREGGSSPRQVARLGVDLIQAVCWLSCRNLVHRDIKPDNVMWAQDRSRYVLLDTGIALDLLGRSLTGGPWPVGTPAYLSPEQTDSARKRNLDFRSDLFAVGVVLYESALGEHPFSPIGATPMEAIAGILTSSPEHLAKRIDGFPPKLSQFVARLMGKSPHLRYRTCKSTQEAIEEVAVDLGVEI